MSQQRAFVIGIDAATPSIIERLIQEGRLPTLERLMREGAYGRLQTVPNKMSPSAWPSFMTGKNPGRHGAFVWTERIPGTYDFRFVNGSIVEGKPFWTILSESGKRVGVINVPFTYPARAVNGFIVSGIDAPGVQSKRVTYPANLMAELHEAVGGYVIHEGIARHLKTGNLAAAIDQLHATTEKRFLAVKYLMQRYPWDLFVAVFYQIDAAQHCLWKYMDPEHPEYDPTTAMAFGDAIPNLYVTIDRMMDELLRLAGDAYIIVLSDHGAQMRYRCEFFLEKILETIGLLSFHSGRDGHRAYRAALENLLIRALKEAYHQLDARLSREAKLKLVNAFPGLRDKVESTMKRGHIDWSKTRAYRDDSLEGIWINLKGREPQGTVEPGEEYEKVRELIIEKLQQCVDAETGSRIVRAVYKREEIYHGKNVAKAPDVLVSWDHVWSNEVRLGTMSVRLDDREIGENHRLLSGAHSDKGILLLRGEGIKSGYILHNAHIMDIAPTILHLFNQQVPSDMDGRVLVEAFEKRYLSQHQVQYSEFDAEGQERFGVVGYSPDEVARVEERLRGLGYID